MTALFPLITIPYVTRVLGADSYGRVNFSLSIVNYFVLFAGLGIATYAIREGAMIRGDQQKINRFASQMFTINIVSTALAYVFLAVLLVVWPQSRSYISLMLVQSTQILAITLGMDWINNVYEDFLYITIRYVVFQILAIIGMFVFIHGPGDYLAYSACTMLSVVGGNLCNIAYIRRYVHVRLVRKLELRKHLRPVIILFGNNVASLLYITAGTTILGILMTNVEVGIYSVPVKIYTIVKNIMNAVIMVAVPRVAFYIGQQRQEEAKTLLNKTLNTMVVLVVPAMVGLSLLAEPIIFIISGAEYSSGAFPLQLLCVAMLFGTLACFFANAVLVPFKKEKYFLQATCLAAACNVALNCVLIPSFSIAGTAIATIVSEFIVMVYSAMSARKVYKPITCMKSLGQIIIGCAVITVVCWLIRAMISVPVVVVPVSVVASVVSYILIMLFMKNEAMCKLCYAASSFMKRLQR